MNVIYKYPLRITSLQTITLPVAANFLKVAQQDDTVYLWAIVNTEFESEDVNIRIIGTGHEIDDGEIDNLIPIDTVVMRDGHAWHVFEVFDGFDEDELDG